ncbi:hypothetical protein DRH14_04460 [Candidatus Shapirobacteria bacterium]|nr:MAG: hypothetical protein DRH14_04460 [Candidatus Shapirobacteria bacterium]
MGKEKITPLLKKWAKAKLIFLVEDETQKDIALEIIKAVEASISDTVDALKVELSNYFLEKVTNFLRAIISKHLLPIFLKII